MTCLSGVLADSVALLALGIGLVAALVLFWTVRTQAFGGKIFYASTFLGVIWSLAAVGLEAASTDFVCQFRWATIAWFGHALVPVAWCFFVFSYVSDKRSPAPPWSLIAVPAAPTLALAVAATNRWHGFLYTEATAIPPGGTHIVYAHGPAFYAIIAVLYVFVLATLARLARAFVVANREAWPLLAMLVLITLTPLLSNVAYVGFDVTIAGLDPTVFMFTFGILVFTWMLVSSRTIDMAAAGRSLLFDTMSEPVVLIDRNGNIVLANAAAKRSVLNDGDSRPVTEVLADVEQVRDDGRPPKVTIGERTFEPRVQRIESPLNPSGTVLGYSLTFVDITERIAIHEALEEALREADEANGVKDDFISMISHEMRTPLTSLKSGLALALSGRVGDMADPVHSLLEIAHRNGTRLSRLVDNILIAQKMTAGALSLDCDPVDLAAVLEESIEENRMFAAARQVRLVVGRIDRPAIVSGDAFALRQIVDNIISNAIKFSHEKGVVEGNLQVVGSQARLSIEDTGPGIPDAMEDRVFGRFMQVASSGKGSSQGSGLGLHISKQLAQEMSGDIFYESRVGTGTTFHVEFGLANSAETAPARLAG